jgi:hypothetical protein
VSALTARTVVLRAALEMVLRHLEVAHDQLNGCTKCGSGSPSVPGLGALRDAIRVAREALTLKDGAP